MERDLCTSSGPTFCSKQGWSAKFSSLQEFCGTDLKCWPEGSSHLICLAKLVLIQPRMQWSATATRASADSCSASLLGPHILFLQNCYPDSQSPPWAVAWSYLLPSAGLNLLFFFFFEHREVSVFLSLSQLRSLWMAALSTSRLSASFGLANCITCKLYIPLHHVGCWICLTLLVSVLTPKNEEEKIDLLKHNLRLCCCNM